MELRSGNVNRRGALKLGIASVVTSAFAPLAVGGAQDNGQEFLKVPVRARATPIGPSGVLRDGTATPGVRAFINFAHYGDLTRIASVRQAHFAYADSMRARNKLAIGGPLLDHSGQRVGLLFIYVCTSKSEAISLAENDPFFLAQAWRNYEITEWRPLEVKLDLLIGANRSGDEVRKPLTNLFVGYVRYLADRSQLAAVLPAHLRYDRDLEEADKLAMAGPFANNTGGLLVFSARGAREAMRCFKRDPLFNSGLDTEYEFYEWLIEGVNPALLAGAINAPR